MASELPCGIEPKHVRASAALPAGTLALLILAAMVTAALAGVLGGTPSEPVSSSRESADLSVTLPKPLRSGMFFEARIAVNARRPMSDATVGMPPALWRSITVNTEIPQAESEEFAGGLYRLHYGPLAAGDRLELKLDAQINPDLFLGNSGDVVLFDGDREITRVPVEIAVLP